jgi:hypothetical protein
LIYRKGQVPPDGLPEEDREEESDSFAMLDQESLMERCVGVQALGCRSWIGLNVVALNIIKGPFFKKCFVPTKRKKINAYRLLHRRKVSARPHSKNCPLIFLCTYV